MGTEIETPALKPFYAPFLAPVKLNNPQMGTEIDYRCELLEYSPRES